MTKKMSKTRAFALCLISSTIAVSIGYILILFGLPGVLTLPICAVLAWYFMGWFLGQYKINRNPEKIDYGHKVGEENGTNGNWK
jgi:hypothetical protein